MNVPGCPLAAADRVLEKLRAAGWVRRTPDDDSHCCGWAWTKLGETRRLLISFMIHELGLARDEQAALRFTRDVEATGGSRSAARSFWIACVEELGLDIEEGSLRAFVRLIQAGNRVPPADPHVRLELSVFLADAFQIPVPGCRH